MLCAFLLLSSSEVWAQDTASEAKSQRYVIDINGAGDLRALLNDNLDLARHRSDGDLSEDEVLRLVGAAPDQIRALLATEGYFSPTVTHELDRKTTPWIARFEVVPGPATTIESVDIVFTGALSDGPNADERRIAQLRRRWSLREGEVFRQKAWDDAKGA
ncbi:MAG TPA: POTRA domain-containing protein, partial [Oxalicibacterium sp.]|nr:POTRA domain-containing protein [Oxalicibacterium sp.]